MATTRLTKPPLYRTQLPQLLNKYSRSSSAIVDTAAVAAIAELHGSICLVTYRVWFGIPLVINSDPKGACELPG